MSDADNDSVYAGDARCCGCWDQGVSMMRQVGSEAGRAAGRHVATKVNV
jgi:hypothetical protein